MDVRGKVFVVTGGGNGIGRATVLGLLAKGASVAAVDLRAEGLEATAELAGRPSTLSLHTVDVTDRDAVAALPDAVVGAHGAVDSLLNIAGIIQKFVPFAQLDVDEIERVMTVNFWGPVNTVRAFLPILLTRPQAAILNVSSMGGFIPVPGQTVYGASKAAVKLFTEGLHAELRGTRVKVTVVFPGGVATSITENSGVRAPAVAGADPGKMKLTTPEQAADAIITAVEKGSYRVVIGGDARAMDVLTRLVPERAMTMIADKMASLLKH
jgi:short-subunit dehydrogenase